MTNLKMWKIHKLQKLSEEIEHIKEKAELTTKKLKNEMFRIDRMGIDGVVEYIVDNLKGCHYCAYSLINSDEDCKDADGFRCEQGIRQYLEQEVEK